MDWSNSSLENGPVDRSPYPILIQKGNLGSIDFSFFVDYLWSENLSNMADLGQEVIATQKN